MDLESILGIFNVKNENDEQFHAKVYYDITKSLIDSIHIFNYDHALYFNSIEELIEFKQFVEQVTEQIIKKLNTKYMEI